MILILSQKISLNKSKFYKLLLYHLIVNLFFIFKKEIKMIRHANENVQELKLFLYKVKFQVNKSCEMSQ